MSSELAPLCKDAAEEDEVVRPLIQELAKEDENQVQPLAVPPPSLLPAPSPLCLIQNVRDFPFTIFMNDKFHGAILLRPESSPFCSVSPRPVPWLCLVALRTCPGFSLPRTPQSPSLARLPSPARHNRLILVIHRAVLSQVSLTSTAWSPKSRSSRQQRTITVSFVEFSATAVIHHSALEPVYCPRLAPVTVSLLLPITLPSLEP